MSPPTLVERYRYSQLQTRFADLIRPQAGGEEVGVQITSSGLADLDNDGASDDLFGTGLLQVGSQAKSFVFLLREDGVVRFLEASGERLRPRENLQSPNCFASRPWLCASVLERAAQQIRDPSVSMMEFDSARTGLELVIRLPQGRFAVVNSLELFANP